MATHKNISELLDSNPFILRLLVNSENISDARQNMFNYLNQCEQDIMSINCVLHPLEMKNARDCINVFKNIISESNEEKTNTSCLYTLWKLATEHWRKSDWPDISDAFLMEMKHLFKGVMGLSGIYSKSGICKREVPAFVNMHGRDSAVVRSNLLDEKAEQYYSHIRINEYKTGLEESIIQKRLDNKQGILDYLSGTEENWNDYHWQLEMCFKRPEDIENIIDLSSDEKACLMEANAQGIAIGITPFYLSLMDKKHTLHMHDRALRSHVIPNCIYLEEMLKNGVEHKENLDFMHEIDTSPEDLITRRYCMIAIIKPYNWCPQICIYCQRNWELSNDRNMEIIPESRLDNALEWFKSNKNITEVLITGGDPLTLSNSQIEYILEIFSQMEHIKRIRIGTRTLVTMPMRFDSGLLEILQQYHRPPYRTITLATHVQHSYEISVEMAEVCTKIKRLGIDIYNQQVYTMQNCRKFETCFLRENLKAIGITPYYLFNLKGKNETKDFKVPIARLLQEQKEEARLMPGLVRTDRPVFNIPTLGKNNLTSCQDHDLIMIDNDGCRIYEFYPWEKYMAPVNTFIYKDEPIYDFLKKLEALGEDIDEYKTIWYYF